MALRVTKSIRTLTRASILLVVSSVSLLAQGKNPLILIPGLGGSELKSKTTHEKIWLTVLKPNSEDLRLPISPDITKMHDDLEPGEIIRVAKIGIIPIVDVYDNFIKTMGLRAGYHVESWETPSEDGYQDSLYIFPYDWRLDNVENARLLVRRVEALKLKLKKPDLQFDVVAHSMGGIISRYAVMYGDADLPDSGKPVPTWAGAKHFRKVILLGTPNEGSPLTLDALLNGLTIGGVHIELPFLQDTSKFTAFTIPATYQLLPAPGTLRAFDERLNPVTIDIYDPKVWSKYGWNAIDDKGFKDAFKADEQKVASAYFASVLHRAKRLHEALAATSAKPSGTSFFVVGSDCKTALDSIIVYRDDKANKWRTLFTPKGFVRTDGSRTTDAELKKLMISPGDGIVTSRSLSAATESNAAGVDSVLRSGAAKLVCEEHNKLAANSKIQDYIIRVLNDGPGKDVNGDKTDH